MRKDAVKRVNGIADVLKLRRGVSRSICKCTEGVVLKYTYINLIMALFVFAAVACSDTSSEPAPTPEPTMTFAPGKTEYNIILDAAVCRLLVRGFDADEIRGNAQLVNKEIRAVHKEYLDGKVGLSGLHEGTQKQCAGG